MFADDTASVGSDTNISRLTSHINVELAKMARWFRANKMAVNVDKTKFIIFHTRGKQFNADEVRILFNDNEPNNNNPLLVTELERYHSNHVNRDKQAYKLLGIYFDEHLSFDYHITKLTSKLNKSLFCINRAKHFLNKKSLITLYYALIHSHLTYCPIIVSCTTNKNITLIHKTQKKAIRIVTGSRYNENTSPIFSELKILPYPKLIEYFKSLFMHSFVYGYAPPSFSNTWPLNANRAEHDHNLRNNNLYAIPPPRIELFKKSPLYSLPTLWNDLDDIKFQRNRTTFKIGLKELFNLISD
jgi:hypothetical protein